MQRILKFMKWMIVLLAALFLTALALVAVYAWRSLPASNGEYVVEGLSGPIEVVLDGDGVPTVHAQSETDLAFAQGFLHARDRLWQLELHRRIGRGELAEIFGPQALETDKFLRTLGIHRAARAQFAAFPEEDQAIFRAYAAGVNAWIEQGPGSNLWQRPPEFVLLGIAPGRWSPEDSVAWALMMAWDLGGNWNSELLRLQLSAQLPTERVMQLAGVQASDPLPTYADFAALYRSVGALPKEPRPKTLPALALGLAESTEGIGSNSWVVHGSRTRSGRPLLANDPHLGLTVPAIWYFGRFRAPGLEVTGATLPGLPGVVLGRTRGVAWGFTNTGPDVQDLYLEEFDAEGRVRTPEGWASVATRRETIRVRGAAEVTITVRETRHGPVISDHYPPAAAAIDTRRYGLALRWSALDGDNTTALTARRINRAQSVAEVKEALRLYVAPMQNVVIADTQGNTAFIAAGRVPIRAPENDLRGLAPAPGWEARYDWKGWLPFERLPQEVVTSFRATANQRVHGLDYPDFITAEWAHPGRKMRIEALLEATAKHDAASLRAIQHDVIHTHDTPLLDWVDRVESSHALAAEGKRLLKAFAAEKKVDAASDSAKGALLYWLWSRHAARQLFADDIGEALFASTFGRRDLRVALNRVASQADPFWCDRITTAATETCAQTLSDAFTAALEEAARLQGRNPARWRWDTAHVARSEHRPFSRVPLLRGLFEIREPTAGDTYTVMVGKLRLRDPEPLINDFAASLRAVYDLAVEDPDAGSFIYSAGQSGHPFSPHYRNFAQAWARGGPEAQRPFAPRESAAILQLYPAPKSPVKSP
ncbi:MAG: penicillin acylase family protein [Casimicrobiaceae bacterium]|nr:penicillin acylase family protein [Casimicrobiaceae bacterium]